MLHVDYDVRRKVVVGVKPVLKTTCIEGLPVDSDHCRLVWEPLEQYYCTST